jgi:hypothetical protein
MMKEMEHNATGGLHHPCHLACLEAHRLGARAEEANNHLRAACAMVQ